MALALARGGRISHPAGQGGLRLTRVELDLRATLRAVPREVVLRDATFAGRVGWRAIVARAGRGTAVRSDVAVASIRRAGLRAYPADALSSPLDQRSARPAVRPATARSSRRAARSRRLRRARRRRLRRPLRPRGGRARRARCSSCSRRSPGARCTRSRRGTARRWSRRTSSARAGRHGTRWRWAPAALIPCPSALVVLLGAISQHEVALGLLLVTAFSLGLAATLTALGLLVVYASRWSQRVRGPLSGRLAGALPALSAAIIVAAGTLLTVRAIPGVLA